MRKCVFFDRDGVVNQSPGPGYVARWEDFILLPGFVTALRVATDHGYAAVVITNQRGVSLGAMPESEVQRIHANLRQVLHDEHGLELLDVLYCPHDNGQCTCRKPQPGMLTLGAERHGLDLANSWMVGDSERDIEAGHRAGCRAVRVCAPDAETAAEERIADMADLADCLRRVLTRNP